MKREKSALEVVIAQQMKAIRKHRIRLMTTNMSDKDMALNHALIHVLAPSPECLLWVNHYLKKIT